MCSRSKSLLELEVFPLSNLLKLEIPYSLDEKPSLLTTLYVLCTEVISKETTRKQSLEGQGMRIKYFAVELTSRSTNVI